MIRLLRSLRFAVAVMMLTGGVYLVAYGLALSIGSDRAGEVVRALSAAMNDLIARWRPL